MSINFSSMRDKPRLIKEFKKKAVDFDICYSGITSKEVELAYERYLK